jgi:hypothetical protein
MSAAQSGINSNTAPDFASLHPGYGLPFKAEGSLLLLASGVSTLSPSRNMM